MTEFVFWSLLFFIWPGFIVVAAHATLGVWGWLSDDILGGIVAVWAFLLFQGVAGVSAFVISASIAVMATGF